MDMVGQAQQLRENMDAGQHLQLSCVEENKHANYFVSVLNASGTVDGHISQEMCTF